MINIEFKGTDELIKRLGLMKVAETLDKTIKKSVLTLEREAKIEVPVDKGFLKNSFESKFLTLEGKLFNKREYAFAVHEGYQQIRGQFVPALGKRLTGKKIPPNPYMTRARAKALPVIQRMFDQDIEKLTKEITK